MRRIYRSIFCSLALILCACVAFAQTNVSGKVSDAASGETLAGVNIVVKGRVIGTITDIDGNFSLKVNEAPPLTIAVSFVGYRTVEVPITNANTSGLDIKLEEQTILGQEIVVSASRVEESILESPVSIEKMDILQVQNTAADNYYKAIANLKGVDVATSSINFQIINTRGFGSTGNTRFVQLTDGMDTQAPALNFPIGNLNGPSELDVESVELIPGASSALYGPNAFNGILLVTSKNPFEYQGLSAFAKAGVNHIGKNADQDPAPMWEGSIRYAKAFKNKIAFKANISYMKADDWHGTDARDREIGRQPAGLSFNPGADRLHYMGDEAAIPMSILRLSTTVPGRPPGWQSLATSSFGLFEAGVTAWDYAQNGWLPGHVISAPSYKEENVVDYGAENLKLNGGLYYRLTDRLELSYLYNAGFGTSVYTGAQRYSLANFSITQHRLQLRADNFFVRAYTTRENSGDSYIAEFLAKRLNDIRSGGNVSSYLGSYAVNYLRHLYNEGYTDPNGDPSAVPVSVQEAAHIYADQATRARYPLEPGTDAFETAKQTALNGVVPDGPKFKDATNLYHAEAQYDFKNQIDFMELQAGASYRLYDLNSNGTIFDDADGNLSITEYGAYAQAGKWLGDRRFKLTGSLRYDKNENFKGQFNPRIAGVLKLGKDHNIRLSYQTGFRLPSTQGQHIDLNIISARLLGGLPRYAEKYNIIRTASAGMPLSYEGFSVQEYRNAVFSQGASTAAIFNPANTGLLVPFTFNPVKPEQVKSIEVGYKSLLGNSLLVDLSYYYNIYNDFITQARVVIANEFDATNAPAPALVGTPNYATMLNGTSDNTYQIYTNADEQVTSQGAVIGLTYNLPKGYALGGNYSWNVLQEVAEGFLAEFNTPEHKVNLTFGNRKLTENLGFNLAWRWQSEFEWQSSFTIPANGMVPAYNTLDAQVSYKLSGIKSILKVGGSNVFNKYYIQSIGGVNIGAIYYISLTFDELLR